MPLITLPDGSQRSFDQAVSVFQVAESIGAGLAKAALAGKVNDQLVDTSYLMTEDSNLAIITARDDEGVDSPTATMDRHQKRAENHIFFSQHPF